MSIRGYTAESIVFLIRCDLDLYDRVINLCYDDELTEREKARELQVKCRTFLDADVAINSCFVALRQLRELHDCVIMPPPTFVPRRKR